MPRPRAGARAPRTSPAAQEYVTDVLVLGGGPAGAWAALIARKAGADVILADKGYLGTSGATAPSNTETWCVPPGAAREAAVARHTAKTGGLSDESHVHGVLEAAWRGLHMLSEWGHPFALDDMGRPYRGNLRGPDYMRFLRRSVITAGVRVLDHHPALELLASGPGSAEGVGGAAGVDRQLGDAWQVRAGAVVLATGGCAFGERILGATGLTGDGYLMAVEAGASLSGMELSSQYAVTPAGSSLNKGMPYRWASFYDAAGRDLGAEGDDRQEFVARALQAGPVFARFDKANAQIADWLRQGQPNCFLPFDRCGVDPFKDRFQVVLRCEGTVRGVGGVRLVSADGETGVPGLFAAGDVASRESLTGAITGGGGPNASWAIASGQWAGRAAASFTRREGRTRDGGRLIGLGSVGMSRPQRRSRQSAADVGAIFAAVGAAMLPLDRNFHRRGAQLEPDLAYLDGFWRGLDRGRESGGESMRIGTHAERIKLREAAAMLAASRWALASAIARRETRGMHRRADYPALDASAPRRLLARGLDTIEIGSVPLSEMAAR